MADRRRRGGWLPAGIAALIVIAVVVVVAGPLEGRATRRGVVNDNHYPTSFSTVTRGSLSSQLTASGTLTYATRSSGSPDTIVNQAPGTFSELPSPGQVISRGQVLYRVSNDPVVLLYGDTPVYRSLFEGDTGPDVRQLNRNLVALGYATRSELDPNSDYFSASTAYALERLQDRLGEHETGALIEGQAVFLPGRIRIAAVRAILGRNAVHGVPIALATSTSRQVIVDLSAAQQTEVRVGDRAQITLPSGQTTPGLVSAIGTVANSGPSGPTLPVHVKLEHPGAARKLDQAPVQIQITTATIRHALIVPIDALLARSDREYAVETVDARGLHHLEAVRLGAFDDAAGTVQVAGDLHPGERIVVPGV